MINLRALSLCAIAVALALPPAARAQSSPGFVWGQVPTAAQWNSYFASKQDLLDFAPLDKAGDTMQGPLGVPQLRGSSGVPAVAAGAGAGTAPTVSLTNAHDTAFDLSVTTGTGAGASATVATVTFTVPYLTQPHCAFSPTNDNAAALNSNAKVHETLLAATWKLVSGSTPLADSTAYTWSVVCFG